MPVVAQSHAAPAEEADVAIVTPAQIESLLALRAAALEMAKEIEFHWGDGDPVTRECSDCVAALQALEAALVACGAMAHLLA